MLTICEDTCAEYYYTDSGTEDPLILEQLRDKAREAADAPPKTDWLVAELHSSIAKLRNGMLS